MKNLKKTVEEVVSRLFDVRINVELTLAPENTGADYATNIAMQLAKLVHKAPMIIGEMIKHELDELSELEGVDVSLAAPGFLNFRMSDEYFAKKVWRMSQSIDPSIHTYQNQVVVAEFSDPNPFKVLHVGHLYTSIVGESISRLLELADGKVVRVNFGGDVGLHVGKTLYSLQDLFSGQDSLSGRTTTSNSPVRGSSTTSTASLRPSSSPCTSSQITLSKDGKEQEKQDGQYSNNSPCTSSQITSSQEEDSLSERSATLKTASAPSSYHKYDSVRSSSLPSSSSPLTSSQESEEQEERHDNSPHTSSQITSSQESDEQEKQDNSSLLTSSQEGNEQAARENTETDSLTSFRDSKDQVGQDGQRWWGFLDKLTIEDIARAYVVGTQAYDEDEQAKAEIVALNKEIYRINAEDLHDTRLAQLYWRGRELSYQYFKDFYAQIGVHFDKFYPESSVASRGLQEVRDHLGTVYEESEGAVVYRGEKLGLHTRVFINREGVPTYETKDVGLIFTKWDDWHFDESVVVTGNEQTDYMKVVLASVAEYAPDLVKHTTHLTHGLVKLPGNVKMSSRKGNFLKAVDVLEMVREMLGGEQADKRLVLAAIKYAFLKYKMGGDIIFDPQESVSTTGNSGIYIIYSAVRAQKILDKSKDFDSADMELENLTRLDESEARFARKLNKKLAQYYDVLNEAVKEKAPNHICSYLYELAQEFSRFYENVHVAGHQCERELLKVVRAYANVMYHGLGVLGIEVPEEM